MFREIKAEEIRDNVFTQIGKDWTLIAAEKGGKTNAMTASWGGLGVLFNKNVVFIFVRKSRFTRKFIDAASTFSLNFPSPEKYRDKMVYFGRVSGRTEDKIEKSGFTVIKDSAPYFEEADRVLICRKLTKHYLSPEGLLDPKLLGDFYQNNDFHYLYVGEIVKCLEKV